MQIINFIRVFVDKENIYGAASIFHFIAICKIITVTAFYNRIWFYVNR